MFFGRPSILLAEEQTLFTDALRKLLEPEFYIVGAVENGRQLLQQAPKLLPDIVLLGILMPLMNGIESGRRLKELLPNTRIIILTALENPVLAAEVTSTWASGYLVKKIPSTELILAIRRVIGGETYVASCIQKKLNTGLPTGLVPDPAKQLTPRQREIIQVLAEGKTMKEAATIMGISTRTAESHKYEIMRLLGVQTTAAVIRYAVRINLI